MALRRAPRSRPDGHPRVPSQGTPRQLRRRDSAGRGRVQRGAGGLSCRRNRRRPLGREGADPLRRSRQGRRHQALHHRGRGENVPRTSCSASGWSLTRRGPRGRSSTGSTSRRRCRSSGSSTSASCSTGRLSGSCWSPTRTAAWRSKRSRKSEPETILRQVDGAGGGHAGVPGSRDRLRARARSPRR